MLVRAAVIPSVQAATKVLVVDDNAENRAFVRAALEDEGYEVILAANGEEALRRFVADPPACVLLDVRMPDMDGFTVCGRIRALPNGSETPVIFVTALRDVDTFDAAQLAGGDDFLTKPVRPTELAVRVQTAVRLSRLGTELREHYDLVRKQRDDLMRLQLQKERLTAFVVHDLKNPVGAMELHAQLLLREPDLSSRARDSLQHIRQEARALLRMVVNLLDISKAEEGQLLARREDVDLTHLVSEIVDALAVKAGAAEVTLVTSVEAAQARGETDLLRRVIENLVDNALRYAPKASRVEIRTRRLEDAVEIAVSDAGPGIAVELREKIFERYVQLERGMTEGRRTGHGLGLAFCKLAVEAHGGTISVEPGAPGAIFRVRLPL